jgi:hypothetical protein
MEVARGKLGSASDTFLRNVDWHLQNYSDLHPIRNVVGWGETVSVCYVRPGSYIIDRCGAVGGVRIDRGNRREREYVRACVCVWGGALWRTDTPFKRFYQPCKY